MSGISNLLTAEKVNSHYKKTYECNPGDVRGEFKKFLDIFFLYRHLKL